VSSSGGRKRGRKISAKDKGDPIDERMKKKEEKGRSSYRFYPGVPPEKEKSRGKTGARSQATDAINSEGLKNGGFGRYQVYGFLGWIWINMARAGKIKILPQKKGEEGQRNGGSKHKGGIFLACRSSPR